MESAINLSPLAMEACWKLSKKAKAVWFVVQKQLLESQAKDPNVVSIEDEKLANVLKDFGLIQPVIFRGMVVPTKWRVPKAIAFISRENTLEELHANADAAGIKVLHGPFKE